MKEAVDVSTLAMPREVALLEDMLVATARKRKGPKVSKYKPHQGAREIARRLKRMNKWIEG